MKACIILFGIIRKKNKNSISIPLIDGANPVAQGPPNLGIETRVEYILMHLRKIMNWKSQTAD